jgi:membrane-associated phospholipid phosphatase
MNGIPCSSQRNKRLPLLFVGVLVPLFVFGLLAEEVFDQEIFSFDQPILLFLHAHATKRLDQLMFWSSHAGSALMLVPLTVIIAVLLYRQQVRQRFAFWVLAVGGAAALNYLAKLSFARARPTIWVSILPETTFSFPSGHAMATVALVTATAYLLKHRARAQATAIGIGAVFVILVGVSRVYLGVHYPSDVLAGWLASFAWVTGVAVALRLR